MNFYTYRDLFSFTRKQLGLADTMTDARNTYEQLSGVRIPGINDYYHKVHMQQCIDESIWYSLGKPYYKIWTGIIGSLTNIKINSLKCSELRYKYEIFEIRFPIENNPMGEDGQPPLRSILVSICSKGRTTSQYITPANSDGICVWMDFGEVKDGSPQSTFFAFRLDAEKTLEEAFASKGPMMPCEGYMPSQEFMEAVLRLVVAVMFFSVGDQPIIGIDLPKSMESKHKQVKEGKYDQKKFKKELNKKNQLPEYAIGGYVVGKEIDLPTVPHNYKANQPAGEKRWEISYGYVRSPHLQWYWVGPGRKEKELKTLGPVIVRPDLPMKTPGFNIGRKL